MGTWHCTQLPPDHTMTQASRCRRFYRAGLVQRLLIAWLCWLWPGTLRAVEYQYTAPEGCPDRQAFVAETTSRLRFPIEDNQVERLVVSVVHQAAGSEDKGRFHAELLLSERGFEPVTRSVAADDCAEAVGAIALAAALALDARAEQGDSIEPAPRSAATAPNHALAFSARRTQSEVAEPPPLPDSGSEPEPVSTAESEPPESETAATAATRPPASTLDHTAAPEPAKGSGLGTSFELAAGGFAALGYAPTMTVGPELGFAIGHAEWSLGLVAFYGVESTAHEAGRGASFEVLGAALRPCRGYGSATRFRARACATLEYSGVFTRGLRRESTPIVYSKHTAFAAVGGLVGLGWPLGHHFQLDLQLGLAVPFVRHRFGFTNNNGDLEGELHRYPALVPRSEVLLSRHF